MCFLRSVLLVLASASVAACMAAEEEALEPDLEFPDDGEGGGEELPGNGEDGKGDDNEPPTPPPPPEPVPEVECEAGFEPFGQVCKLIATSKWDLVIKSADIPATVDGGGAWDPFGGDPDGYVVVTFGPGVEVRTQTVDNSLSPTWDETVVQDARASELNMMFHIALYDSDWDFDPLIGECDVPLANELFDGGTYSAADLDAACPAVSFALLNKN